MTFKLIALNPQYLRLNSLSDFHLLYGRSIRLAVRYPNISRIDPRHSERLLADLESYRQQILEMDKDHGPPQRRHKHIVL